MSQLIQVSNLRKHFPIKGGVFGRTVAKVFALDGVSFSVKSGETLGIVGESGCGKSTLARVLIRLETATDGSIQFNGRDITDLSRREMIPVRRDLQIVFQDPFSSLNPRQTIGTILDEPLKVHNVGTAAERIERIDFLLNKVGLRPEVRHRFPHEFSGGQRQRISIARALTLNPKLLILDEPVSALDVSIQAQILNLLMDLQEEFDLTYLFIAHDLSVVELMSDRVMVMYLGKVVEIADGRELFSTPVHPYTKALLQSVPVPDPKRRKVHAPLEGDVPSPINPPEGCHFHPRCPYAQDICRLKRPELEPVRQNGSHLSACHFSKDLLAQMRKESS